MATTPRKHITVFTLAMMTVAAAIRLRYTQPDLQRSYRVPGGDVGMWLAAGIGFIAVAFAFVVGFFPPTQLPVGSPDLSVALVAAGAIIFVGSPLLISAFKQPSWAPSLEPTPKTKFHSAAQRK
ncbi:MAG: amino acid permease [Filomicrobium sp.]